MLRASGPAIHRGRRSRLSGLQGDLLRSRAMPRARRRLAPPSTIVALALALAGCKKDDAPADLRRDLFEAMTQVAQTGHGPAEQIASIGCSIKWKHAA